MPRKKDGSLPKNFVLCKNAKPCKPRCPFPHSDEELAAWKMELKQLKAGALTPAPENKLQFECSLCQKVFNGVAQQEQHLTSKGHKEAVRSNTQQRGAPSTLHATPVASAELSSAASPTSASTGATGSAGAASGVRPMPRKKDGSLPKNFVLCKNVKPCKPRCPFPHSDEELAAWQAELKELKNGTSAALQPDKGDMECTLCGKKFNGAQMRQEHLQSRGHKAAVRAKTAEGGDPSPATPVVVSAPAAQQPPQQPTLKRPKPAFRCRFFAKGRCRDGQACRFSHDPPTASAAVGAVDADGQGL
jgi:hypothetical protein